MLSIARRILLLLALGLLFGCGSDDSIIGDGGDGTPPPGGETPVNPSSIQLLVSSPQLASAGTGAVTLTAIVKNSSNVLMEGVNVAFSSDSGSIQTTRAITDANGTAEAVLTTSGDKTNRIITVSVTAGAITTTGTVQVTGTNISISGQTSAAFGQAATLTITLRDSAATVIPGQPLTITSALGNTISNPNPTTDSYGTATITVTPNVSGTDTITVVGGGATAIHALSVSPDNFAFITPAPATEVFLGTAQQIIVQWKSDNTNMVGQTINFATSRGTLSSINEITDSEGKATVTIQSDNAGPAIITATASGGPTAQLNLLFVATTAHSMTLQASPATIGTNPTGGSAEQSEIIAVVRDPANNLVKGKTINFTLTDTTGGMLASPTAITDAFGRASVTYIAGAGTSAQNGVRIDASVADTPSVSNTVYITVARTQAFIGLETATKIVVKDPTRYALPAGVTVTDTAGGPVANTQVTLTVIPRHYHKGYYTWVDSSWAQIFTLKPSINNGLGYCKNEDVNRNGILDDEDNDENNNGVLDPGNLATLSVHTVTTNNEGYAPFEILYFQNHALWVEVELTARATMSGSEATKTQIFTLPILASALTSESVPPPGHPSPFGTGLSCASDIDLYADTTVLTGSRSVILTLTQNDSPLSGVTIDASVSYLKNSGGLTVTATGGATDANGQMTSTVTVSGGVSGDTAMVSYQGLNGFTAVTVIIP